ncbi:heterokaryon incompatibility protein-domain-containing protein, partial [Hypoxylon sp. NC1633]
MPSFIIDSNSATEAFKVHLSLSMSARVVENIAIELAQRDPKFLYIADAIVKFLYEESGFLNTFLHLLRYDNWLEQDSGIPRSLKGIAEHYNESANILKEIVDAAIYETLDIFDLDLTIEQVPLKYVLDHHVKLLLDLYEKSKCAKIRPKSPQTPKNPVGEVKPRFVYQYPSDLVSLSKEASANLVRVLHLLPGSGASCIECQLEVRDLDTQGIDQALSYVWGSTQDLKCIWIEGRRFAVTTNLYHILTALRHEHTTQTIWIDAICINQSNNKEKAHQVRLMGEIYSKAKETIIWLGNQVTESRPMTDPANTLAPLPPNFGGHVVDQYNLVDILGKLREMPLDTSTYTKRLTLYTIFLHCLNVIMLYEWWEQVWM